MSPRAYDGVRPTTRWFIAADRLEAGMRIVLAEGLLSRDEAAALREEAHDARQSPLALLVERGRLSERTYRSLVAIAFDDTSVANLPAAEDPGAYDAIAHARYAGRSALTCPDRG